MPSLSNKIKSGTNKTCASIISCSEPKRVVFEKKGFRIKECEQCGHRFLPIENSKSHLSDNYSDDYFFNGGDGYPNYLDQKEILLGYGVRYAKIISKYTKPGKILDVGSAAGFILKGFEQAGWECSGTEPNDTMAAYGRNELGLNIATGGLETYKATTKFDLVSMIQVIGHFYDIDVSLRNVADLLNDNGLVLVESWNMKSMFARILGSRWHEYSPPSVVHWFSDETLVKLFNYYGFELIDKGYPAKKINVKHTISFIESRLPGSSVKRKFLIFLERIFGKVNLIYPPLDIKWYLFRKS
jgi:SAM-dependent methyltransferase